MLIKKLSFIEIGKHYGYPECCINNFYNDHYNLKLRQEKYQSVYGYLPCSICYELLENGMDINTLLRNRKCIGLIDKDDKLNYDDEVSQQQYFLNELELLLKKTIQLLKMPYDNILIYEQLLFIINPKRMRRKKVSNDRIMTFHSIKNIYKLRNYIDKN